MVAQRHATHRAVRALQTPALYHHSWCGGRYPLTIVYTDHVDSTGGIIRRLISARVSHRKERRRYAKALEAIRPQDDADAGAG